MAQVRIKFRDYPAAVKYAVSMVYFSWFFFIVSGIIYTGRISIFHLTMAMLICFLAYSMKKMCVYFIPAYHLFMSIFTGIEVCGKSALIIGEPFIMVQIFSIMLFAVSAGLFLIKKVRIFFKENGA